MSCCVSAFAAERAVTLGVDLGYAHQQELLSSGHPPSNVQLLIAHGQFIPTLWNRSSGRIRSLQLVNEIDFMQSIKPGSRFIIGDSEIFRLNRPVSEQWSMYYDIGLGISSSGLRVPENKGWMQYLLQAGVGFKRCEPGGRVCRLLQYRFMHMSNNNTTTPNNGLNMHAVFAGVNF